MVLPRLATVLLAATATLVPQQALHAQSSASVRQVATLKGSSPALPAGVVIPPGRAVLWTSGTTPPMLRPDLRVGAPERFGDTRAQSLGVMKEIQQQLIDAGLTLRDVIYLRVYLVNDRHKGDQLDISGWNAACAELFGIPANPAWPAQAVVGVPALTNPEWLVEVEAVAVYPR